MERREDIKSKEPGKQSVLMLVTVTLTGTSSLGRKGLMCLLDQLWFNNLAGFRTHKAAFNDFQSSHHHAFAYPGVQAALAPKVT